MEKIRRWYYLLFISFGLFAQKKTFVDQTTSAGIHHVYEPYEGFFGGGAAVFDFDQDGWEDLYLTGGMQPDQLLKNNRNGTFSNIFEKAGLQAAKEWVTTGVVTADFNQDGWVDILVSSIKNKQTKQRIPRGRLLLFLNQKNGSFREVSKAFGLNQASFSLGLCVGDVNLDGFPDVYVGNYFQGYAGGLREISDATIVNAKNTAQGFLLINLGGKRFENAYESYGLHHKSYGFGGIFTDFDKDGDQDLLVLNDFGYKAQPNALLENQYPFKRFRYIEKEAGMDLGMNPMGAAVADLNKDGRLDYYLTNIRFNKLMMREGIRFEERSKEWGMQSFSISWGANFADFDQDGMVDLFVSNGDLNPNCQPMFNFYFKNSGKALHEMAYQIGLNDYGIGRGSVVFDYDHDGDMDLLVVNQKAVLPYPVASITRLYRNDYSNGNFIKFRLVGREGNREGLGAQIELWDGNWYDVREMDGGNVSHLSQNSRIFHIGLGARNKVKKVRVTWLGGHVQEVGPLMANKQWVIYEGPRQPKIAIWLVIVFGIFFAIISILIILKIKSNKVS